MTDGRGRGEELGILGVRCSSTAVVYDKVDKDVNNEMAIVEEVNVKKRI